MFGARGEGGDETVQRLQRPHEQRQELPVAQDDRQELRPLALHHTNQADCEDQDGYGHQNAQQRPVSGHRQAEDDGRQDEEHADQVGDGEPAVLGRRLAEKLGHRNGNSSHRNRIEQYDAGDVEQQVAQRNLQRVAQVLGVGRHGSDQTGRRRADIGAQRQWVHSFDGDDSDSD